MKIVSGSARRTGGRPGERGQTLVEFALVASFFLSMIFGIVDFGEALFAYDQVTNAARLGSRYAMVRGSTCTVSGCPATLASIRSYVLSKSPGLNPTQTTIVPTWSTGTGCTDPGNAGPYCIVTVSVSYNFHFIYKFAIVVLSSTSKMVISQ